MAAHHVLSFLTSSSFPIHITHSNLLDESPSLVIVFVNAVFVPVQPVGRLVLGPFSPDVRSM